MNAVSPAPVAASASTQPQAQAPAQSPGAGVTSAVPARGPAHLVADVAAGFCLGLLFGLLLGLSVAQAVGGVIAALAALLAAFLGLSDRVGGSAGRIIGFGLGAALAVLAGVGLRAQDALSPSPYQATKRWTQAGFDPAEARALVAFERLGVRPAGREVGALPQAGRSSALFAGASAGDCQRLAGIEDPSELLLQFDALGGTWAQLAPSLRATPQAAGQVRELACGTR